MSSNQLNDISKVYMEAVYGGGKKEEKDTRMVVTNADKKANTPAYQAYKAGKTSVKTGKPLYKAADHLKDNYEFARHKASIISRGGRLEDAVESWNQKLAYREAMKEVSEKKEVNVKDTYKTVAAIVDYDRAKKGSKDAAYDSMKGDKEAAKKERDYAAWERSKMKKDDPNWKHKKYHTGMHGESYETTKTKEVMGALKKRDLKQDVKKKIAADIVKRKGDTSKSDDRYAYEERRWQDDDGDGKWYEKSDVDGKITKREKKATKHQCASKVKHEEFGVGNPIKGMHDLDENGVVQHYDVFFEHGIEKNVPVSSLEILEGSMHEHVIHNEKIEDVQEADIADILARLEKKRISKGGDPEESPLPAMRKYHADKKKKVKEEVEEVDEGIGRAIKKGVRIAKRFVKDVTDDDPGRAHTIGSLGNPHLKNEGKKKVKKESLSDWRTDLNDLIEIVDEPQSREQKEVVEKKVKNKVIINPKFTEAVEEMGGELLEMVEVTEEYAPEIEAATEYFYAEGINEDGLDAIIEEVGLDTFVDFVIDSAQDLNEERAARKMTARNLQTLKKKTIPAAKKAEALRKKEGKGEYSAAYKKKETDVTVYDDKPKAKAKAKPKAKPIAVKKPAAKKVAAVTKQVKKLQPAKKASKSGLGDKIRGAIKKGVARHQAARAKGREPEKRVKEFGKGFASGVKGAVKFAGKVKKIVSEEEKVKKELGYLSKAVKTMKGKNVAKADKVEEGKNCGCGQNPCVTYG